jgi:uncharacterized protein
MAIARAAALLVAAGLWSASGLAAQAWEAGTDGLLPIPPLSARVTDLTQTLSASETQALEAKLADWEARTSNQLAVLLVPTTQPEPIEAYSLRVAEKWKIGRKGQDNGVLFLIAKNDRKMRFEVGYGLEGVVPDVIANRIIREAVAPAFREGKFAAGIDAGVDRIIAAVGGQSSSSSSVSPVNEIARKVRGSGLDFETILVLLFFVIPVAGGILRRIFGRLGGSVIGGGAIGAFVGLLAGSIVLGLVAWGIVFLVMLAMGMGGGMASRGGRGGGWTSTGGGGWSGGGGGWSGGSSGGSSGGFSGGGGSFGGGGSSGSW